jgi:hypothetical protein
MEVAIQQKKIPADGVFSCSTEIQIVSSSDVLDEGEHQHTGFLATQIIWGDS